MFQDNTETYRGQAADSPEEGWRYCQGDKNARRPPELLTRDHVARSIVREIKAGRGSPHGGVFLDISWLKEKLPNAAEHIRRKLPSRSEEHTSELQSQSNLVCRLLLEKKKISRGRRPVLTPERSLTLALPLPLLVAV